MSHVTTELSFLKEKMTITPWLCSNMRKLNLRQGGLEGASGQEHVCGADSAFVLVKRSHCALMIGVKLLNKELCSDQRHAI